MKKLIFIFIVSMMMWYCQSDEGKPADFDLEFSTPENFPALQYNLSQNQPTNYGFELGKKLFYDGRLAKDNVISCGFCHEQKFVFTHHGHTVSHGVDGGLGFRNAQPIQNLAFQSEFMWDGAAVHLDLQPIIPITSEVEMGESFQGIIGKLENDAEYIELFGDAFEDGQISSENILKALSQFMVMMVSSNSKYDKYVRGEDGVQFTADELAGQQVFTAKCGSCHSTDLFTDQSYRNNGLPINSNFNDVGRERVTGFESDRQKFKVPSLRNVEHSFPYMHDGRLSTLSAVIDFYRNGVVDSPTLDPLLKQADGSLGIPITDEEKTQLISFLLTLTDDEFLNDERFAEF